MGFNSGCKGLKAALILCTSWSIDVRGSVHHTIIHTEIANKTQHCIKIYYSMFIWSSTCFGRHTSHHQELKTALAASGFACVKGCWTLWLLDADSVQQCIKIYYSMFIWSSTCFGRNTAYHQELKSALAASGFAYVKPEAANAVLSSWWWAVSRPKHVELYINME